MDENPGASDLGARDARVAFDRGEFTKALEIIRALADEDDPQLGALERDCHLKLGEISTALGVVGRMRRAGDTEPLRRQARFMLGRLRETDTTWSPPIPAAGPSYPARKDVVLHLLKESLPYSQTGYTFRSRMALEAQRRAGFEPVAVTSLGFPAYKGVEGVAPREEVGGIVHHRLERAGALEAKRVPYDVLLTEQAERTSAVVAEERPALIQAHSGFRGYDQALVGSALARRFELPFVYEVRGFLEATWSGRTDLQERGEYYWRRRAQDERCMREADLVITIAGSMQDELVRRGIDPDAIRVVPNAVDVQRFRPRPKDEELARRLGLAGRFVVGYISNLGQREGVEHLLRATARLVAKGEDVACLIVGDGPERPRLEELSAELGNAAVLTGHVPNDQIEDHYALIDTFVVPRIDDQAARFVTPLKPLEAMAMRVPVISSDLPALREIIAPGERGLTFTPGDDAELASMIADLMEDAALRGSFAEAAYRWVTTERTLDANVERYHAALTGLLA